MTWISGKPHSVSVKRSYAMSPTRTTKVCERNLVYRGFKGETLREALEIIKLG